MKIKFWAFNMRLWEGMALSFPYFPGTSIERGRLNWINSWQMVSFQMNRMIWNTMWGLVSNWYLMNFWSPGCAFDISVRESTMMPCLMKKKILRGIVEHGQRARKMKKGRESAPKNCAGMFEMLSKSGCWTRLVCICQDACRLSMQLHLSLPGRWPLFILMGVLFLKKVFCNLSSPF